MQANLLIDSKSSLGEGAIWNQASQELYWIDIELGILYLYNPITNTNRSILLGQKVGTVVPTTNGTVLVALQDGIYELHLATEQKQMLVARPEPDFPQNRFNDGKCDAAGRFWVGTLSMLETAEVAALYVLEKGVIRKKLDKITVSNGIVWSLDNTKMYYIDSPTRTIKEFDYDIKTGAIKFSRIAVQVPENLGYPDGMTMDSEGMLWVAMWEGFCVARWNPNNGELLMRIEVPVLRVTSCAFGGKNLDTLYITTAKIGAKQEELDKYVHSGSLFVAKTGHQGIPNTYASTK
jgi:sugar lactone lactonase YvrE